MSKKNGTRAARPHYERIVSRKANGVADVVLPAMGSGTRVYFTKVEKRKIGKSK